MRIPRTQASLRRSGRAVRASHRSGCCTSRPTTDEDSPPGIVSPPRSIGRSHRGGARPAWPPFCVRGRRPRPGRGGPGRPRPPTARWAGHGPVGLEQGGDDPAQASPAGIRDEFRAQVGDFRDRAVGEKLVQQPHRARGGSEAAQSIESGQGVDYFGLVEQRPQWDPRRGADHSDLIVCCDVRTSVVSAASLFGPQQGPTVKVIAFLRQRLSDSLHLDDALAQADLVVTGEGQLDHGSFDGKVVGGVVTRARRHPIPVVVIAGDKVVDPHPSPDLVVLSLVDRCGRDTALADPAGCTERSWTNTCLPTTADHSPRAPTSAGHVMFVVTVRDQLIGPADRDHPPVLVSSRRPTGRIRRFVLQARSVFFGVSILGSQFSERCIP